MSTDIDFEIIEFKDDQEPAIDAGFLNTFQKKVKDNSDQISNINNTLNNLPETNQSDGILTGSVIGYNGATIPEGYEEVPNPNLEIYSLQEVRTNKVWLDGKPVYQKVISFTTSSNIKYYIETELTDIDTLINISGVASGQPINYYLKLGNNEYFISTQFNIPTKKIIHVCSSDYANQPAYAILEYTKTTDVGGETI